MRKKIITGIVLTVAALALLALCLRHADPLESKPLGSVSGRVTDAADNTPLVGVAVQVVGTTMGSLTDPQGKYLIKNIVPGSYTLKATMVGYVPQEITALSVSAGVTTQQDFQLTAAPQVNACQVVKLDEVKLQSMELFDMGAQNMSTSGQVQDALTIRGGRAAEKKYQVDGVSIKDPLSGQSSSVQNPSCYGVPMSTGGSVPPNGQQYDAMFFKHYGVNPFISTDDDHLSTFAIDADNASYSMTRSYLTRGSLPPEEAVRVEEFVNNFKYDYKHPRERAFRVCLEGAPSKFGSKYQLLKIGIVGRKIDECQRKDANLVFVIDVSGSMNMENRLGAVKKALHMLVDQLSERDRVGIVAYRTDAYEVLPPTSIRDRGRILDAINQLYADGSTWAEGGLRLGYETANRCFDRNRTNRIILCTDGVANEGQTAAEDILKEIKQYADRGITLSAIGFGMNNYNDVLLEKLGDKGNGHYAYVDNWEEARRIFVENLTGTLEVIARDVKIQVDFNPNTVDRYRLLGYENRDVADNQFRNDKVDGGEIGSGHTVTALYEIKLKDEAHGDLGTVFVRYKDPTTFAVSEVAETIDQSYFSHSFESASTDFRLAAAAAEFAEIMRKSYWAQGSRLNDVLRVVGEVERERSDDQVIELRDLITKADRMIKYDEEGQGPLGMETE
jgi:Ca-activated chloride channel homolog